MLERRTASAGVLRAARVVGRFVAARARRVVVMWRMVVVCCVGGGGGGGRLFVLGPPVVGCW
jgi:hypothetical protein